MAYPSASSQKMINDMVNDMINVSLVTYIDDILTYSSTKQEYLRLINEILSHLQTLDLGVSIHKYESHKSKIEFLGNMISDTGINMAQDKVQMVLEWERPKSQKEVQAFMRFPNCYRRFIKDFQSWQSL
jgi:hypothetical protein